MSRRLQAAEISMSPNDPEPIGGFKERIRRAIVQTQIGESYAGTYEQRGKGC